MQRAGFRRVGRWAALLAIAGCAAPAPVPRVLSDVARMQVEPTARELEAEADGYAALGRRDLAAPLYSRALETRAADDRERASDARSLAELAVIEHDRGHLDEAEHFYRRALAAEEESAERDPDLHTLALANLAWLLGDRAAESTRLGRAHEALLGYEQALAAWEPLQPASDELVAQTLANLALLARARGDRAGAHALLARALPLYEKTRAPEDPDVQRVRAMIAEEAAPPVAAKMQPDSAALARDLDRRGAALLDRRDYARARPLLERAVAIHERGVTAPVELGASLSYLGRTYAGLGERDAARKALARSLALLEPALGKLDPLTLATRASLENLRGAPADRAN